ncbi:MAG: WYL domain-containing protein, partial [Chloroflexi bacterium]|nr:WYL domain-containing protein [Chloroflexota bacterium]
EIGYARSDKVVTRVLEPLGIVLKAGIWYLLARTDDQMRTYRVSRVTAAPLHDERFDRPDDFDLAESWAEITAAYEQSIPVVDVRLRVDRDKLEWLQGALGPTQLSTAIVGDDPERTGWAQMDVRLESLADATDLLLRFGGWVEVTEPLELRNRLVDRAKALLDRYAVAAGGESR